MTHTVRPESDAGLTFCEPQATRKAVSRGRRPQLVLAVLAVITLASADLLLAQDGLPRWFPPHAHELLATLPLGLAALCLLASHMVRRVALRELPKTLVLVAGFLFWSANQLWPHSSRAPIFNDIAIALFALDVVLVIVGRAPDPGEEKSA
jgi:peptidoglycan/LPS O-acetylase OafA/YrhL